MRRTSLVNNYVMFFWKMLVLFSKFCFEALPFFTKFHRGGFLGMPLGRIFKFTISKPLGGVLGPITLGIVAYIADSKTIYPE